MHSRLRKLLVVSSYGFVEGDVQTMLTALRGFQDTTLDVSVITKPRGEVYKRLLTIPHLHIHAMETGGGEANVPERSHKSSQLLGAMQTIVQASRLIQKQQIEAIYTIDRGIAPQIAAVLSRITHRPFVLNAAYPFYPQNGRTARFVLRQASRIHVHSRYLYQHLEPFVADKDHMVVIPNAIELERYDASLNGRDVRATHGIDASDPVVVMTGRINQYKGQDDLIQAAAQLIPRYPNLHVLIAGRGPEELQRKLEQMIVERNISNRVRLIGYVPSIPALLSCATVVAMPSWEEPFGLVALEGMAMAKPVVATNAGGVPEFMHHKQFGLLVTPRDPSALAEGIGYLIEHPLEAKAMGQAGRREVENLYTTQHYIRRITNTILDAMGAQHVLPSPA